MGVWDPVVTSLARLQAKGWRALLQKHGLDIGAADLKTELTKVIAVDRTQPGFQDFSDGGTRALEAGDPALSLLYHAFASPLVHPGPGADKDSYPRLDEIDALENLIYSLGSSDVPIGGLVPAVFAYEYRTADATPHKLHADLVFSRTGIARNGNEAPEYDAALRAFRAMPSAPGKCPVSPARYAVFLARREAGRYAGRTGAGGFFIDSGAVKDDDKREFLVPVHKLFDGDDCVMGESVTLEIVHRHVNEKLHRAVVTDNGIAVAPKFSTDEPPFIIVSQTGDDAPADAQGHVFLDKWGASAVVRPHDGDLIWPATQIPIGETEPVIVTFKVPRATLIDSALNLYRINRRYTSYHITENLGLLVAEGLEGVPAIGGIVDELFRLKGAPSGFPRPRNAPEFMNIRHSLDKNDSSKIVDMRATPESRKEFLDDVKNGNYQAVLFLDGCADGCVSGELTLDGKPVPVRPAFSIVAPPDFFPKINQVELVAWLKDHGIEADKQFKQGGPDPLSLGRLIPNQGTVDPATNAPAFADRDQTMVAMVSLAPRGKKAANAPGGPDERASFLTDASSNVFAPGWDVTYAATKTTDPFYATYGLGSPFPEDAKLCAAANAYWPAVSPDASRTFGRSDAPTAMPLTDEELGYYGGHPWVRQGKVAASHGWDGESGPFIDAAGLNVNYADIWRSDYVANMRTGLFAFDKLAGVDATEMGARMDALRKAVKKADGGKDPADTALWLISFERVEDWAKAGAAGLNGAGYRLLFVTTTKDPEHGVKDDPARLFRPIGKAIRCRVDLNSEPQIDVALPGAGALALYGL